MTRFQYSDPLTEDTAENRLKHTVYLVEADSFAQHALWCQHSSESLWPPYDTRKGEPIYDTQRWEQEGRGWLVTVGELAKMPVCISVNWYRIDGRWVCFWYACSQVTDSRKAEKWLEEHFQGVTQDGRPARCDANNFHHCLQAIKEANIAAAREG